MTLHFVSFEASGLPDNIDVLEELEVPEVDWGPNKLGLSNGVDESYEDLEAVMDFIDEVLG